jgi:hypothetical protein
MIINTTPANEAIVSNVSGIGEFRIRNSAKAFSILSSGLYANKIRAIIRELSCNAYDSHVAAGKKNVPFDVHLPNSIQPHFSIRDYGVGLSHDQVINIYTTYFESTKTTSNEFIGALGLGSKSPFSYTDNFTVTAIKNGRKGIYTAFINDVGVPSIALMMEEDTDEPSGVEVRFAVSSHNDFSKFIQEASYVYQYFDLKPVITGHSSFQFSTLSYESRDIIPGVHALKGQYSSKSIAVMGNIAYPIDVPSNNNLDNLDNLLNCSLEIQFEIGELDFQASREGLSYIPSTVEAIKNKLKAINSSLADVIAREANKIENLWDRSIFLAEKHKTKLWNSAVKKYILDNKLPTFDIIASTLYLYPKTFKMKVDDLAKNWNISIQKKTYYSDSTIHSISPENNYEYDQSGNRINYQCWEFKIDENVHFVINDLNTGAGERTAYHYKNSDLKNKTYIWILNAFDKNKEMDLESFFDAICGPGSDRKFLASSLEKKERKTVKKNASILHLQRRGGGRRDSEDMVWREAGNSSDFPETNSNGETIYYYYVPLVGYAMESKFGYKCAKNLYEEITCLPSNGVTTIYGVRKADIAFIKTLHNWKNCEDHVHNVLQSLDINAIKGGIVRKHFSSENIFDFDNKNILKMVSDESTYKKFVSAVTTVDKINVNMYTIERLLKKFLPTVNLDINDVIVKYDNELEKVRSKYPMMGYLSSRTPYNVIADYINMTDKIKGI